MIHTFSLPQLLLQSLTLSFDIHLFSPFIPLEQLKGFDRWYLTILVHFAPNLISSASTSLTPQPPILSLVCTCVPPCFQLSCPWGYWGGLEGPMPRPRVSSISAVGCQGPADLFSPSPMRLKRYWRSSAL